MNAKRWALLTGLLSILWVLGVAFSYFITHKPFDFEAVVHLGVAVWRLLVTFWIIAVAGGIGCFLFPLKETFSPLLRAVVQGAVGLGALALLVLGMGSLKLHAVSSLVLLLLLTLCLRLPIRRWMSAVGEVRTSFHLQTSLEKCLAAFVFLILMLSLLTALAPPLMWDSLTYHLTLPEAYVLAGRVGHIPRIMFGGMPQTLEMLYTLAMALGGGEAAAALGWSIGLLTLLGLWDYTAQRLSSRAGWVSVATLLCGETLAKSLYWAYAEWMLILYGLVFLVAAEAWLRDSHTTLLILAALAAGFAISVKYTGGVLFLSGIVVGLLFQVRRPRLLWKEGLLFVGLPLFLLFPWWLKNLWATGNPLYPLFWPTAEMSTYRLDYYSSGPPWGGWWEVWTLPWQITFLGVEHKVGPSASIGPLLLGLSPQAFFLWRSRQELRSILRLTTVITVVGFIAWAVASRFTVLLIQTRLYVAFFPAWAFLSAAGFEALDEIRLPKVRFGRLASALVALVLFFNAFSMTANFVWQGTAGVLLGQQTLGEYIRHNLGNYAPAMEEIKSLPPEASVLMLWETRGFYCWPKCDPDEVIDRWYDDVHRYQTPARILQSWREQGYTHLLLCRSGMEFIKSEDRRFGLQDWVTLDRLLAQLSPLSAWGEDYRLYSLVSP